jgi:glycosyltransferase involved in cell wall biosynthesis
MSSPLQVNIAVCGRFHYHKWVKYLDARQINPVVYYSHKIGERPFGEFKARNKPLKEYVMQLHGRVLGDRLLPVLLPAYHRLWESSVLTDWAPASVAHVMLHGNSLEILKRCRRDGTFVIGEAVNAHTDVLTAILEAEHRRLGLRFPRHPTIWSRMVQEYALCDRILVPSEWVARSFVEAGISAERLIKVPYPAPAPQTIPDAQRNGRSLTKTRLLCVAGVQVRKGLHHLLDAVRTINSSRGQIDLTLVGRCNDRAYWKVLRGMNVPFTHIDHVPNRSMIEFMHDFDVFVLPSVEDGFGVVISEALQAGLPVVTTTNTGAADIVRQGKNGFVVPAGDSTALADAIQDAALLDPHSDASNFSSDWRVYATEMAALYVRFAATSTKLHAA